MLPLLLIAALALSVPAPDARATAAADSRERAAAQPQDDAAKLKAELITKLLGLATWCNDKELFLQRDSVWRSVLALESENAAARQGLRYAHDASGKWKEPAAREVKDRNAAALPEFGTKRSEIVGSWRDQNLALLEKDKADADKRAAFLEEVLLVDPDDAVIHGMRGEARSGTAWVLQETVAGEARRTEFKQKVQKGREGVPEAAKVPPSADDLVLLPAWKTSCTSDGMHLLSQTAEPETKELLLLAHAGCALAESVCGKPMTPPDGFTVYALVDPAEREKLLAAIPGATDADKKLWKTAAGFGIPRSASVVVWDKDGKRRVDCFARHLAANLLYKTFKIETKHGWLYEGLGSYLAYQMVGSRMTWFVGTQPGEVAALRAKLWSPKTDWFAEADRILKGSNPPKLAELLGKDLSTLKLEDMVVAQAFAAYLAEGLPKEFPQILERIGAGENPVTVIEAVSARPLAETEKRLARWVTERH